MLIRRRSILLPQRHIKRSVSIFLKSTGFKRFAKYAKPATFIKAMLMPCVALYLMGYQPTLAIPPVRQSVALAQNFTQEQKITRESFSEPFILPHTGYLTTTFSNWHPGIDIAVGLGMPVHPISKGKVTQTSFGFLGLGHFVVVEHEKGLQSTYGHMGRIFVKAGDEVNQSSILGEVGLSGFTTGPHTHLELALNGERINPLTVLPSVTPLLNTATATRSAGINLSAIQ